MVERVSFHGRFSAAAKWALAGAGVVCALHSIALAGPKAVQPGTLRPDKKGNIVWKKDIRLTGDVIIPAGADLVILPGTVIHIGESASNLTVEGAEGTPGVDVFVLGRFLAGGTAAGAVTFIPEDGVEWGGISLLATAKEHQLAYTRVSGAKAGVRSLGARAWMVSCHLERCGTGLVIHGGQARIERCTIAGNGEGIRFQDGPSLVTGCVLRDNGTGLVEEPGPAIPEDIEFTGNSVLRSKKWQVALEPGTREERILLYNWWGTSDEHAIRGTMDDGVRSAGRGQVTFFPFLAGPADGSHR